MSDHHSKLRALLERCNQLGIKLNRDKSLFCRTEVEFLGHLVTSEGLKPDHSKIDAILKTERPSSGHEIQRLNVTVNYLARFLSQLSAIMQPLMMLTRKEQDWAWGVEQEKSFNDVKDLVTQTPVPTYFDVNKPLTLQCDSSEKGLGAALMQDGRPVVYASRAIGPRAGERCAAPTYSQRTPAANPAGNAT